MTSGLVVAVIGGIGCGKSAACSYFAEQGYPVIDTDQVAKQLMQPGQAGLQALVADYGHRFLTQQGELDRPKLAAAFFSDQKLKHDIEQIIHPLVRQQVGAQVSTLKTQHKLIFVAIPVISQVMQPAYQINHVLLIECDPTLQRQRVATRDQRAIDQIERIIAQQADPATRQALADSIINNNSSVAALHQALQAWLESVTKPEATNH